MFSDGLDNTNVELLNSGPSGIDVTGNPAGSASGLATGATILENGAGEQNTSDDCEYTVSNGGNLSITGVWWEGPVTTPIFDLSGTGNILVNGIHMGYYEQSTDSNEIELNNFTGNATFLDTYSSINTRVRLPRLPFWPQEARRHRFCSPTPPPRRPRPS